MTQPQRFLVSLHIHDTTYSFRISPCPLCSLLWISGLWHSTEIDSLSVIGFFRRLLRLLIIIRSDTPIFLTGEQLACFLGLLSRASFLVSPDSWTPPLALCFQVLLRWLWSQPDKQRKLFREEKVRFPTTSPTSYVPSSHKVTFVKGYISSTVHGLLRDRASSFR